MTQEELKAAQTYQSAKCKGQVNFKRISSDMAGKFLSFHTKNFLVPILEMSYVAATYVNSAKNLLAIHALWMAAYNLRNMETIIAFRTTKEAIFHFQDD